MELVSSIKDVKKLSNNSISIWGIQVSKYSKNIDNIYKILSKNEQSKANNFKDKNHARASVLARWALRILLGAYENSNPEELNFSKTKDGKPFLPNSRINFNISHSSDWIILAFCKDHSIGVDLEAIRVKAADNIRNISDSWRTVMLVMTPLPWLTISKGNTDWQRSPALGCIVITLHR